MNKPATFNEAFKILDRSIAEQPHRALGSLMGNEMQFFKSIVAQETSRSLAELSRGKSEFVGLARDLSVIGAEESAVLARKLDEQIRLNPALFIGGFAVAAFACGLLASASHYQKGAV